MNESNMGEGGKSWKDRLGGAVRSFASFGREVLSGQSVNNFVNSNTEAGQRFVRATDTMATQWGVDTNLVRDAADGWIDPMLSERQKEEKLQAVLKAANIQPGTQNYETELANLKTNLENLREVSSARRSTYGQMFSSKFDDQE